MAPTFENFCKFINPRFFAERVFFDPIFIDVHNFLTQSEADLLMINLPQSAGKSYFANLLSAWLIGIDNELSMLRINSTQSRANDFTRAVNNLIENPEYKAFFPLIPKTSISNAKEIWLTGNWNASYRGVGADVSTMSARANLLLIDDVYSDYVEAANLRHNEKLITKYTSEWVGRLEGSEMKVISVGTRYTKKDFYNYLETILKLFKAIKIPALDEHGKSFCEYVRTTERFHDLKRITDEDLWNAVYQQEPTAEGQILVFKDFEFQTVDVTGLKFETVISVTDPSFGVGADYFVTGIFGLDKRSVFLIDLLIERTLEYDDYIAFIDKHNPRYRFMEQNGVGNLWIKELTSRKKHKGLAPFSSVGEKYSRIYSEKERIKQIIFSDKIKTNHMLQLKNYPDVDNDDFPDMLAHATRIINNSFFTF